MESVLAHIARKERRRLTVVRIDVDDRRKVAGRFAVGAVPTLVLVRGKRPLARIEGRASAARIEALLDAHLDERTLAA